MTVENPLLRAFDLPPYGQLKAEHIESAIDTLLADGRRAVEPALQQAPEAQTWESLVATLDEEGERLSRAWSPVSHLNAVCNNAEWRQAYEACLPKLSQFSTEMGQHTGLLAAYQALYARADELNLDPAQCTILSNALRDFRLSGIDLPSAEQQRYGEIQMRLSELGSTFANNVLDATQAWTLTLTDEAALAGLPDSAKAQMKQAAEAAGEEGWRVTLEFPSY